MLLVTVDECVSTGLILSNSGPKVPTPSSLGATLSISKLLSSSSCTMSRSIASSLVSALSPNLSGVINSFANWSNSTMCASSLCSKFIRISASSPNVWYISNLSCRANFSLSSSILFLPWIASISATPAPPIRVALINLLVDIVDSSLSKNASNAIYSAVSLVSLSKCGKLRSFSTDSSCIAFSTPPACNIVSNNLCFTFLAASFAMFKLNKYGSFSSLPIPFSTAALAIFLASWSIFFTYSLFSKKYVRFSFSRFSSAVNFLKVKSGYISVKNIWCATTVSLSILSNKAFLSACTSSFLAITLDRPTSKDICLDLSPDANELFSIQASAARLIDFHSPVFSNSAILALSVSSISCIIDTSLLNLRKFLPYSFENFSNVSGCPNTPSKVVNTFVYNPSVSDITEASLFIMALITADAPGDSYLLVTGVIDLDLIVSGALGVYSTVTADLLLVSSLSTLEVNKSVNTSLTLFALTGLFSKAPEYLGIYRSNSLAISATSLSGRVFIFVPCFLFNSFNLDSTAVFNLALNIANINSAIWFAWAVLLWIGPNISVRAKSNLGINISLILGNEISSFTSNWFKKNNAAFISFCSGSPVVFIISFNLSFNLDKLGLTVNATPASSAVFKKEINSFAESLGVSPSKSLTKVFKVSCTFLTTSEATPVVIALIPPP